MADPYQQAQQQALAALAQYGTAGQQAYDQAIANVQASQNQALAALAAEAGGLSVAPEGMAELNQIASQSSNAYLGAMEAAKATHAADASRLQGANAAYHGQLQAAVPAGLEWIAAQGRAQGDLMRQEYELDAQRWRMEQELRMQEDALRRQAEQGRYGGYGSASEYENAVVARARESQAAANTEAEQRRQQSISRARGGKPAGRVHVDPAGTVVGRQGRSLGYAYGGHGVDYTPGTRPTPGVKKSKDVRPMPTREDREVARPQPLSPIVRQIHGGYQGPQQAAPRGGGTPPRPTIRRDPIQLGSPTQIADARMDRDQVGIAEQFIRDLQGPDAFSEFARSAAINDFGADPMEAMGRFSPEWAADLQLDDVQRQLAEQRAMEQLGNLEQFGSLDEPSLDPSTRAAMSAARVGSPEELAAVYDSDEYAAASSIVEEEVDTGVIATQADLADRLYEMGLPPEIVRLLTYDYQDLLPDF